MSLKPYQAHTPFLEYYGSFIVRANTEYEALGFMLEARPNTKARDWIITEIPLDEAGIWWD